MDQGEFKVRHKIPYSDLSSLPDHQKQAMIDQEEPLCFGHTLTDQIGGQLEAGWVITALFEDGWSEWPISEYIPTFLATRAKRLPGIAAGPSLGATD